MLLDGIDVGPPPPPLQKKTKKTKKKKKKLHVCGGDFNRSVHEV